jgi:NAD(P)H dehydrogenase (quinone)
MEISMYFVSGASGKLGQLVAHELTKLTPPGNVTLGSRDPAKIASFASQGFHTAAFDFDRPETMRAALKGQKRLLLISGDAPIEERIRQHKAAVDAAKAQGIETIIYTSFTNARPESLFTFGKIHAETEAYIKASGLAYIFLRNNQYAENIASAIAHARETGTYAVHGGKGKVAYIPRADIAFAAATALLAQPGASTIFEITGPKAYDAAEVAALLSRKWRKDIKVAELPKEVLASILTGAKLPEFMIEALVSIHEANAAGEMEDASGDFEKLAGREPESLESFLTRTA